jgi:hypothetical protein
MSSVSDAKFCFITSHAYSEEKYLKTSGFRQQMRIIHVSEFLSGIHCGAIGIFNAFCACSSTLRFDKQF